MRKGGEREGKTIKITEKSRLHHFCNAETVAKKDIYNISALNQKEWWIREEDV